MVDKNCKYFHHEPYMTPNNYDIYFSPNEVPANIECESAADTKKRLQKLMPIDKFIHINFIDSQESNESERNKLSLTTQLRINKKKVNFI